MEEVKVFLRHKPECERKRGILPSQFQELNQFLAKIGAVFLVDAVLFLFLQDQSLLTKSVFLPLIDVEEA